MSKYLSFVPLSMYNIAAFLRSQLFLLPVLLFFYQENGLTVGDFYLIQGLIVFFAFLFEIPAGYLGDIFPDGCFCGFSSAGLKSSLSANFYTPVPKPVLTRCLLPLSTTF